jgi:hypothetical protein
MINRGVPTITTAPSPAPAIDHATRSLALEDAHHAVRRAMTALQVSVEGEANRHKAAAIGAVHAAVSDAERELRLVREQQ